MTRQAAEAVASWEDAHPVGHSGRGQGVDECESLPGPQMALIEELQRLVR